MSDTSRTTRVTVRLSADEAARLDRQRPPLSRSAYMRRLLREAPPAGEGTTHSEAVELLAALAREGKVAAAIAYERALREAEGGSPVAEAERLLRELDE